MRLEMVPVIVLLASALGVEGAQVPITRYTCTQPDQSGANDQHQCTVIPTSGLQTCKTKEGASPGGSITIGGTYVWDANTNPFMVLDIPQGWCVGSVKMEFGTSGSIPTLSLSVHSAERLSNNTDRTMFSLVSIDGTKRVVMTLTALACERYLRINMTSAHQISLEGFEVLGTNDSIRTHPSSAGGNPVGPTTSVSSSTYSVTPIRTSVNSITTAPGSTSSQSPSIPLSGNPVGPTTSVGSSTQSVTPIRTSFHATSSGPSLTPSQSPSIPPSVNPAVPTTSVGSSTHSATPIPYAVVSTPVSTRPSTITTGKSLLTHQPMPTSFPRNTPTYHAGSTDMGCSIGISSAVFFAGLLAGVALAGPAGALSVVCYHWKKKRAKTRRKDSTASEDEEPAYDCPVKLEENPAYEANSFFKAST